MLKSVPDRDFDVAIIDYKSKLAAREAERELLWERLEQFRRKARELELTLATRSDGNLVTQQDVDEQEQAVVNLKAEITRREVRTQQVLQEGAELKEKSDKLSAFKTEFPVDNLKSSLGEQHQLEAALSSIKHNVEKENQRFKNFKRQVERLIDVPCGDSFPGCQYILSAQKANKKLSAQNTKIEEIKDDLKETRKLLKKLLDKDLEAK